MAMKLEELLKLIPKESQERVANAVKRSRDRIRTIIGKETALRLRDEEGGANVPISLEPGLPVALKRLDIPEEDRLAALLVPYRTVLEQLNSSSATVLGEVVP